MGKPERKARERLCSSSSYFLRFFGISRKIHLDKPMVETGQEKKKKKTRSRWFSRATKFRLKNGEITTTPIYETEKQNLTIEDDKQNLFQVIRQVTDRKNIAAVGQETKEFDYETLVKATDGFSPSRLIGKGSHGYVYQGLLLLHQEDDKRHRVVAIKTPSLSPSPSSQLFKKSEQMKKLENEISVMSSLPCSPHVLSFLGHAEKRLMVVEFMPNGSLHQLLHVSTSPPPTWLKRIEIALQIARAVHFLHEQAVLHRDIKSENILFDLNWEPKLADFGLAVDLADKTKPAPAGTIGYLDPSYTSPDELSTKTDIYSYGVVLLEIVSCRKVIDVSRSPASIVDWTIPLIEEGKIGEICGGGSGVFMGTNLRLLRMAARCVSPEAELRPSSGEITAEMVSCLAEPLKSFPLWISFFRGVVKLKRRKKRLRETLTWRVKPAMLGEL